MCQHCSGERVPRGEMEVGVCVYCVDMMCCVVLGGRCGFTWEVLLVRTSESSRCAGQTVDDGSLPD